VKALGVFLMLAGFTLFSAAHSIAFPERLPLCAVAGFLIGFGICFWRPR
jgi:hypothetical protein